MAVNASLKKSEASTPSYHLDFKLRSALVEEFFDIPNVTLLRWEEKGDIESNIVKVGSRRLRYYNPTNLQKIVRLRGLNKTVNSPLIYAVWNNKGGVGKSTLTFEIALMMSSLMGLKVLAIDTDSQGDLTHIFNADENIPDGVSLKDYEPRRSIYDIIEDVAHPENHNPTTIQSLFNETKLPITANLDLIPSDERVSELDYDLSEFKDILFEEIDGQKVDISKLGLLRLCVEAVSSQYDVILIDCPPNIALFNLNTLFAADRLLIPCELEPKCPHSIYRVNNRLKSFVDLHPSFAFEKTIILPNRMSQSTMKSLVLSRLIELAGDLVSRTFLSNTVTLERALANNEPVFCYNDTGVRWYSKIPAVTKRLTNQLWNVCHEMLDIEPPTNQKFELFKDKEGAGDGAIG